MNTQTKKSNLQAAVDDCLERVLDPAAKSPCDFAVVFFEGHDRAGVQEALDSFAIRYPFATRGFRPYSYIVVDTVAQSSWPQNQTRD